MAELLTTDQLLDRVSELTAHVSVDDGRIASRFTERNVRYYVTIGLVRPPSRVLGKSMWTDDHVKDLVRIRRAQSAGQSLSEIGPPTTRPSVPSWKAANLGANRSVVSQAFDAPLEQSDGWAFQISPNIQLSGFTHRMPTQSELQRITEALALLISSDTESTDQQ